MEIFKKFRNFMTIYLTVSHNQEALFSEKNNRSITPKNLHIAMENPPVLIGDTSSHSGVPSQLCDTVCVLTNMALHHPPQTSQLILPRHRNGFTNQHEIHQFLRKLNVFPLTNKLTQQANRRWEDGPRTPHLGGCLNLTFFLCFKEGFDGKWLLEIISGQSYPKILPRMENPTQNGSLYYHKSLP